MTLQSLPIDSLLPQIIASLQSNPNLVIEAPPGAGKTTRVPPALLNQSVSDNKEVWVLEPRRLAARMSARRVAEELGEKLGETVGYQVRFDEVSSAKTRLRFMTEGVLTRRLLSNPNLDGVGVVVLDEFHERHLQADVALALLKRLQNTKRPDLKIVAMSATLDALPIAKFLNDCSIVRSEGRRFDVAIEYQSQFTDKPLAEQVADAVRRLVSKDLKGDVLVFLPGAAEIRRAQTACAEIAAKHNLLVLPLHGDLAPTDQDMAVRPADRRKVILSTNVAETSITIDGVIAVIDSGLARMAGHSHWSGIPTLSVQRVSKASATQRAGRAGRTQPGRCLRLYTAQDFAARPDFESPEIKRLDLSEIALELHAAGMRDLNDFDWYEAPTIEAIEAAENLLHKLGAIDRNGQITQTGRRMLHFPLHPRLSRLLVEAETRGVAREAAAIAALIGERSIQSNSFDIDSRDKKRNAKSVGPSDLLVQLDLLTEAERVKFDAERLREMKINPGAAKSVDRVRKQLMSISRMNKGPNQHPINSNEVEEAMLISILCGFPDRIARRKGLKARPGSDNENEVLLLSNGGAGRLSEMSVVREAEFLVAIDAEEKRFSGLDSKGRNAVNVTLVETASAIEPEWLLDLFPDALHEEVEINWNEQRECLEIVNRFYYDRLVIDEKRIDEKSGRAALSDEDELRVAQSLVKAVLSAGLQKFIEPEIISRLIARIVFLRSITKDDTIPLLVEADVHDALFEVCKGKRSFAELRVAINQGELIQVLRGHLSSSQNALLERLAPEYISLPMRRRVQVNYESGKLPWIESRLQDFFGMSNGPTVGEGRVPIVLHLLAPNHRPVQVTTDLAGFWTRHYPQIRKELSRRYPRHAWPENPLVKS